jgi:hypothetical protein
MLNHGIKFAMEVSVVYLYKITISGRDVDVEVRARMQLESDLTRMRSMTSHPSDLPSAHICAMCILQSESIHWKAALLTCLTLTGEFVCVLCAARALPDRELSSESSFESAVNTPLATRTSLQ